MKLLISQKDELYDIILEEDLAPSMFNIEELNDKKNPFIGTTVVRFNDEYYYTITNSNEGACVLYCPGYERHTDLESNLAWSEIKYNFHYWLRYLKKEINAPDKWKRLHEEIEFISINPINDKDKFTAEEYEDLKQRMLIFRQSIESIKLHPDQLTVINDKLDQLLEFGKTSTKFNWQSFFIGTIVQLIIQLGITPENTIALWALIKQVFNNFILK